MTPSKRKPKVVTKRVWLVYDRFRDCLQADFLGNSLIYARKADIQDEPFGTPVRATLTYAVPSDD